MSDSAIALINSRANNIQLERVLLQELAKLPATLVPGADGLTNETMMRDYQSWAHRGLVPSTRELSRRYPELALQLSNIFSG